MRASLILRDRQVFAEGNCFADLVIWKVPRMLPGSPHNFKYRLAFVVNGVCVLRYDNEPGKGDHKHRGGREEPYAFVDMDRLLDDFFANVERWRTTQ